MDKKEALKKKIEKNKLSQEDKKFWDIFIASCPNNLISGISDILDQFPNELVWLTQIYQRKHQAFDIFKKDKTEGQRLLSEIYKEEREKLEKILA